MEFIQSIDWMQLLRCFVTGGGICIIGQILLDKTNTNGSLSRYRKKAKLL